MYLMIGELLQLTDKWVNLQALAYHIHNEFTEYKRNFKDVLHLNLQSTGLLQLPFTLTE